MSIDLMGKTRGTPTGVVRKNQRMRISAKADYAVRAAVELAAAKDPPVKRDQIAEAQGIPFKFLENILGELKHAGIVHSQRGAEGGYTLARPADEITLADVLRVADGHLASVRDLPAEELSFAGVAAPLTTVWVALRSSMRAVLEEVTLADVVENELPASVVGLAGLPDAWASH
jgi:Rrf2 family protein